MSLFVKSTLVYEALVVIHIALDNGILLSVQITTALCSVSLHFTLNDKLPNMVGLSCNSTVDPHRPRAAQKFPKSHCLRFKNRQQLHYKTEESQQKEEPNAGVEPATLRLRVSRSAD